MIFPRLRKQLSVEKGKVSALFSAKNKERKILKITGSRLCPLSSQQGNVDTKFSPSSVSVRAWNSRTQAQHVEDEFTCIKILNRWRSRSCSKRTYQFRLRFDVDRGALNNVSKWVEKLNKNDVSRQCWQRSVHEP